MVPCNESKVIDSTHSISSRNPSQLLLEKMYQWSKRDTSYRLPEWFSTSTLLGEMLNRALMSLRGMVWRWRFRHTDGITFIGSDVHIRAPGLITFGRSVTLHDHVSIDALSEKGIIIGENVTVREYSTIECTGVLRSPGEGLVIGNNVGIAQYCFIGVRGSIYIGNNVQIGPRVTIYAENHNFDDLEKPIREQGIRRQGITIEDDCWLGTGCTILDGVTVGRGSVVAAGSVVTNTVPTNSIVAGVPGRVLRMRGEK